MIHCGIKFANIVIVTMYIAMYHYGVMLQWTWMSVCMYVLTLRSTVLSLMQIYVSVILLVTMMCVYTCIHTACMYVWMYVVCICYGCNMDMGDLPDMSKAWELQAQGLRAYISGKSREHMLQLLCSTSIAIVTNQSVESHKSLSHIFVGLYKQIAKCIYRQGVGDCYSNIHWLY